MTSWIEKVALVNDVDTFAYAFNPALKKYSELRGRAEEDEASAEALVSAAKNIAVMVRAFGLVFDTHPALAQAGKDEHAEGMSHESGGVAPRRSHDVPRCGELRPGGPSEDVGESVE